MLDVADDQTVISYNTRKLMVDVKTPLQAQDFILLSGIEEKKISAPLMMLLTENGTRLASIFDVFPYC